ncbi:CBS domain-containing protein [Blastococcus sp. TF02A-30]|uniref:CBS domain-containing protein n=1 Tax=Blastococcus sp. TF02A-30 TaxID=2250580 RepID=UPI000DE82055|nr:CBS domain-containing protein [Blastococcus sp. TF02A-30]RBY84936.1 hypothetical protein DQ241_16650 [Blastococcus sp. TF02A-30]
MALATAPAGRDTTVADVMVHRPKVMPADVALREVVEVFADEHVVMLLLTDAGILRGTLLREDLPADASPTDRALPLSRLEGRVVGPDEPADTVFQRLLDTGARRLAVVDGGGTLLGLLCLKRRRNGFCSDAGIAARARGNRGAGVS